MSAAARASGFVKLAKLAVLLLLWLSLAGPAQAQPTSGDDGRYGAAASDDSLFWPSVEQLQRVFLLRDYNTRVVLLGTVLLGACAGVVGTFMLLRKRALLGDVVSHAALPGIACAFLAMEMLEAGSGKWLPGLLGGALVAGLAGVLCTSAIRSYTRIKEDAAMAIVLSVFFGIGVALLTVIQNVPTGTSAGLNSFIYGKAASMVAKDVTLIAVAAAAVLLLSLLFFKEFELLCFDERFAAAEGWPVGTLDIALMGLVLVVTVIGLQSVGLLLMVAMLIIPAAAARFWTDHLAILTFTSAVIGAASACFGVLASALFPRLAAGAVIVLVSSMFFTMSLLFGLKRGVVRRLVLRAQVRRKVGRQHLLRAFYECVERAASSQPLQAERLTSQVVTLEQLLATRSWPETRLRKLLRKARASGWVEPVAASQFRLTSRGAERAQRIARNHRLWELYLIHYADIAPSLVDRDADRIEHILEPEVLQELEQLLARRYRQVPVPPSPHAIVWDEREKGDASGQ